MWDILRNRGNGTKIHGTANDSSYPSVSKEIRTDQPRNIIKPIFIKL